MNWLTILGSPAFALCCGAVMAQTPSPFSCPPRVITPVSWSDEQKTQIEKLAIDTAKALQEHDNFELRKLFDAERFATELLSGLGLPASREERFRESLQDYLARKPGGMLDTMNLGERVEVGFVGLRMSQQRLVARFRTVQYMILFTYWDLEPCVSDDQTIRWYNMTEAELGESEIEIRRCFTYVKAASENQLGVEKAIGLTDADRDVLIFGKWQASSKVTNDDATRLAELDKMRDSKAPIIAKYRLAALRDAKDPKEYQSAADDFVKKFPADPAVPWIRYQRLFKGNDVPALLAGLGELAKAYGDDPFLDAVAASSLANNRQFAEAVPLAKKAVQAVPDHALGHYILAGAGLETGDYDAAAAAMLTQVERFGMTITRGNLREKHPKFCESEPGKRLLEKLPERAVVPLKQ